MNDDQKAAAYYKFGMTRKAPPYVPARVLLLRDVYGDEPFLGAGAAAGEYDCNCNQWGAVSIMDRDGKLLGIRPDEFEPVAWVANTAVA